ncbi:transposase family Tnp2 protein, partial [Rhizoctonia solani 123E]
MGYTMPLLSLQLPFSHLHLQHTTYKTTYKMSLCGPTIRVPKFHPVALLDALTRRRAPCRSLWLKLVVTLVLALTPALWLYLALVLIVVLSSTPPHYVGSQASPLWMSARQTGKNPHLHTVSASTDVDFFGQYLADLAISGASKASRPNVCVNSDHENDPLDSGNKARGGGEPDEPDGHDGAQVDNPMIQAPPDNPGSDPGGGPGDPGGDGARFDIPALEEYPTLRNIYLRTWAQYTFHGVTQETIQDILESHKSALLAGAEVYSPEFINQVNKMPMTLRSLEWCLGMDFSDLITIYPVCPECGKQYTMEELYALHGPQCQQHVGDQCTGILYTESKLADSTRKRTPVRSFPYNSLIAALARLLSRIGIAHFIQHWRRNPDNFPLENPPGPCNPHVWYNRMDPHTRFSDISQASGWHAEATGQRRTYNGEAYVDEPIGDMPISLARSPIGLNLGVGADGHGKFAASSYSANGVYIVINNLPFFLRNLIENMLLVLVLPGPHEPKGYAFDQMFELLVDDLIQLAEGAELPVYDWETGVIQPQLVHANLSVLIVDWISRIKCTGHVGVRSEHNHCPYCKMRQCALATPQGYQSEGYELRDPHEHLQHKHRWLRAHAQEHKDIRPETGTIFTEFDRVPGFFAFDNAPIDAMHLLDLGVTHFIAQTIVFKNGMLQKRIRGQDYKDTPEGQFNAFLNWTIFPYHCSRLPTQADTMDGCTKAEQWRLLHIVMPVAYFEAWRVGNTIPDVDIPPSGQNTQHFKAQEKNADLLYRRLRQVHIMDEGDPNNTPREEDCFPLCNPCEYYGNILRYCLASTLLSQHRVTLAEINQGEMFLEQVGITFAEMKVHLTPSFHATTHPPDHIHKYGSVYNTSIAQFECINWLLANVNTNGHGNGVLEATMAKGFLCQTECYCYVAELQSIEEPTPDERKTTQVLLGAMQNGPEHEIQQGMLEAVIAGEVPMHGQGQKAQHAATLTSATMVFVMARAHPGNLQDNSYEIAFPWTHWNEILAIDAWEYDRLAALEVVPPTAFTGVFALSDLTMPNGHFWITIAMIN